MKDALEDFISDHAGPHFMDAEELSASFDLQVVKEGVKSSSYSSRREGLERGQKIRYQKNKTKKNLQRAGCCARRSGGLHLERWRAAGRGWRRSHVAAGSPPSPRPPRTNPRAGGVLLLLGRRSRGGGGGEGE